MSKFQVKLGHGFQDYSDEEDRILKRAYLAGFPNARFSLRGQNYEYDFGKKEQKNLGSGKTREIRAPHRMKAPGSPVVPPGPTMCVKVPPGAAGTTIQVPHPKDKRQFIAVTVPPSAKAGQAMLVPVPPLGASGGGGGAAGAAPSGGGGGGGMSTGAKVAAVGGVAIVGGLAVAGGLLGAEMAEHGVDATMDGLADGLGDVGDVLGDAAGDAGDFIVDAADSAGDFIMDLF